MIELRLLQKAHGVFFPLLTVALQLMTVAVTKYSVAVFRNRQSATSRSLSQCPFKEVQRQKKKKTPQLWVNCEWFNSVPCWKMFFANANCIALPASFQCVQHRVCDFVKGERKLLNPFSCSGCDCHDASWRYTESRGTTATVIRNRFKERNATFTRVSVIVLVHSSNFAACVSEGEQVWRCYGSA